MNAKRILVPIVLSLGLSLALSLILILAGSPAPALARPLADTHILGDTTYTSNFTWTLANSPYVMDGRIYVAAGVTLTIEPGVTVVAGPSGSWGHSTALIVYGHLQAEGTADQPITFTPVGNWDGLVFSGGTGVLRHVNIYYGDGSLTASGVLTGEVRIEDSQVISGTYGVYIDNSNVSVSNTLFTANTMWPIYIGGPTSTVMLRDNTFAGNTRDRIYLNPGAMTTHDFSLAPQIGLQAYELPSSWDIPAGITITVEPGVTLMAAGSGQSGTATTINVYGRLVVPGTTAQPVIFTTVGDSYGVWRGVHFWAGSSGYLREATIRNATGGAGALGASGILTGDLRVEGGSISTNAGYGLYSVNSHVTFSDTEFTANALPALQVEGVSVILVSGAAIESNGGGAAVVNGDDALLKIVRSTIIGNGSFGVRNNGKSTVVLSGGPDDGNAIMLNTSYGAYQYGSQGYIVATYNWWGQACGPVHATNPGCTGGEEVSNRVIFSNWLTGPPAIPPLAQHFVSAYNPFWVSPGEQVNLGVHASNYTTGTLQDVVVVAELPLQADFGYATGGGLFWPQRHQVFWRLGDMAPGAAFDTLIRVRFYWGLPLHSWADYRATFAASNLPGSTFEVGAYLAYTPTTVIAERDLTAQEITDTLAADAALAALLQETRAQGWTFPHQAYTQTLSDETMVLMLPLLDPARPENMRFVARIGDLRVVYDYSASAQGAYNSTGGYTWNSQTGAYSSWGDLDPSTRLAADEMAPVGQFIIVGPSSTSDGSARSAGLLHELVDGGPFVLAGPQSGGDGGELAPNHNELCQMSRNKCFDACVRGQMLGWALALADPVVDAALTANACIRCGAGDALSCGSCGAALKKAPVVGWLFDAAGCSKTCKKEANWPTYLCEADTCKCGKGFYNTIATLDDYACHHCDMNTCTWIPGWDRGKCQWGEKCTEVPVVNAKGKQVGVDISCCTVQDQAQAVGTSDAAGGCRSGAGGYCPCPRGTCHKKRFEIRTAWDPNALYGPLEAAAGELITYTVEFENVGDGTAYGVYIENPLPDGLDADTLTVNDGGVYLPSTRMLIWDIGQVISHTGGSVSYGVRVPTSAISDASIVNQAVIHFPSVPQTTPTNELVTLIESVSAHSQRVETPEGIALPITLAGYSPTGNPLSFEIVDSPQNGTLTGALPNVVYTPASNFEGADRFSFRASDGANVSLPADVTIVVNTGPETIPPQVLFAVPPRGATRVKVSATQVYTGEYLPEIWAYFSDPISATTVSTQTFYLTNAKGRRIGAQASWDGVLNRAGFTLSEPLVALMTYTATLTTGVYDTSGNPLAANYAWSFSTEANSIYLPLVLK